MAGPARTLAKYEDLLAAPKDVVAEIIHGRLITHPRPRMRHAFAATLLGGILTPPFCRGIGGPGGWVILHEPELHFGPREDWEVTQPDLAGWRRERMPKVPDAAWTDLVPDWICEFISPSSKKDDRFEKPGIYASYGVQYYWLGDDRKRSLETFGLDRGILSPAATFHHDDRVEAPPFAEAPFSLGELWED